jgi:type IV pilus assembly protein PilZ
MPKPKLQSVTTAAAEPEIDRRKSQRADLIVRVDYQTVDEFFSEFARNVNEGGIFVETDTPQSVGTPVYLQFKLPGGEEPVEVLGRVVRTTQGEPDYPPGMGIEFDNLDGRARQRINETVRGLRAGAPRADS